VTVYTAGGPDGEWYSKEICGGPHVAHTGVLGRTVALPTALGDGSRWGSGAYLAPLLVRPNCHKLVHVLGSR